MTPDCIHENTKVAETRRLESTIYRRRCCGDCGLTFITEELVLPRGAKIPYEAIKAWQDRTGRVRKTRTPIELGKPSAMPLHWVRARDKDFDF